MLSRLIHTQDPSCDTIYSIEYLTEAGEEVTENEIVGIRVANEDLQILSELQSRHVRTIVTKEDLSDPSLEDEWKSVKDSCEVFYVETLLAMAESIEQYI